MKIKKIMAMFTILIVMFMVVGCSSNEPVITEVKVVDLKYNADKERIDYGLRVKFAIDKEIKTPMTGIMKVSYDNDDYTKELEWGFMPGQQNADVKFSLGWTEYTPGEIITGKIEMIKGTEIIGSQTFEVVYNE